MTGKVIASKTWLHVEALSGLDAEQIARIAEAEAAAGLTRGAQYNVVRLDRGGELALLNYADFFAEPFPALAESWRFDPVSGTIAYRTWGESLNPPILHRKELLLPAGHARRAEYAALTAAAESIGLFEDTTRIGYRRQWDALVREKGYRIAGHTLLPLGNAEGGEGEDGEEGEACAPDAPSLQMGWEAARQRTAMVRYGLSAPIQALARHGFLDGRLSLFDYGCGRGDDVRGLLENGLTAAGWDPYYAPDNPIVPADLVNLGFVVNVIESLDERVTALTRAWSLARVLLVVSVMLASRNDPRIQGARAFRDGVLTRRGTFQRYFTQAEIKAFLEDVLEQEAVPVAPGVLYVFRDKDAEQRFFVERCRGRHRPLLRVSKPPPRVRAERARGERVRPDRAAERYALHREALEALWECRLGLGRRPERSEAPFEAVLTETFGSVGKALRFVEERKALDLGSEGVADALERARADRIEDLTVYFALNQFERRRPYASLEPGLKRDIKAHFGDYREAQTAGWELLTRIADVAAIERTCRACAERGLGWLDTKGEGPGEEGDTEAGPRAASLTLHVDLVERLPALLRVYVGAAAAAYGDYRNADLLKIHIGSGKLTLMRFDDFHDHPLPRMLERVKIRLREQEVDYFAYGDAYEPPFLYRKSRFMDEEHRRFAEQVAFDEALDELGLFDFSGYGPPPGELLAGLARHRWEIDGFRLRRARSVPDLDAPCGRFFTFRQLIECGETQAETALANLPERAETYHALLELAERILDPTIDWFGMVRLTYGFCSPELAKRIRAKGGGPIDPQRDQHAACECNRLGNPICGRLGAAVDFIVEDESMLEVAKWIAAHTPFDRIYFYGDRVPLHVSCGPERSGQIVRMTRSGSGRLIPRVMPMEAFLALAAE